MSWQDKTTVKKGNWGERYVEKHLLKHGYVPFKSVSDTAHPFDRLVASRDKKSISIAEIKTKPRRLYYPDTGFDIRSYEDYKAISQKHNLGVYIFFVDEHEKQIYGNFLSILDEPCEIEYKGRKLSYPLNDKGIRYFPLAKMNKIADLTEIEATILRKLSTRKYNYANQGKLPS